MELITIEPLNPFFKDELKTTQALSFILGAINKGFQVSRPGCIRAKKGRVDILFNTNNNQVTFWKGKGKVYMDLVHGESFTWSMLLVDRRGGFQINDQYVTKFS